MKISFLGAARTVTGSCYLLEHGKTKFLVDCGMFQGNKALKEHNYGDFPFNPGAIDFVILTHAHVDHSGMLPKLYKKGFRGKIFTTTATEALSAIMLPDSGYIQESEIERKNRKRARAGEPPLEPIYTVADAEAVQAQFQGVAYDTEFSPAKGLRIVLREAGHILGSAMVEIRYEEDGVSRKLVFTGDLGRNDQAIVRDPYIIDETDYLVMESTYGNREHKGGMEEEMPHFTKIINDTIYRGGNVVIPAFAVDRTQDILYMLNEMLQKKLIPECPVYVDSPMAVRATEIFASFPDYYDKLTAKLFHEEGRPPFILENLTCTRSVAESQQLNSVKGAIIISASGMADAGRIKHHLKHNLWRKESSVVFFGYQAEGTLGRRLIDGETHVTIHGEEIDVKAQIHNMEGFSAHADKNEMLAWLRGFQKLPQKIFVTHGEENSALSFAALVTDTLHVATEVPSLGDVFDLAADAPLVDHVSGFEQRVADENLLADINTMLQQITLARDLEKLIRVRDYLKQLQ